jgi:hypothetical protein
MNRTATTLTVMSTPWWRQLNGGVIGTTSSRTTAQHVSRRCIHLTRAQSLRPCTSRPPVTVHRGSTAGVWACIVGVTAVMAAMSRESQSPTTTDHHRIGHRNPTEEADSLALNLLPPSKAQHTKAIRVKEFLSHDEVAWVISAIRRLQRSRCAATIERDARGKLAPNGEWRTSYLHAEGHFRQALPNLYAKLRRAIEDADHEEGWGLVSARLPERVNFRTIECHEYGAGGQLSEPLHYDAGSLVTIDVMLADPNMDFDGGQLATTEPSGEVLTHDLDKGDALIFVSHKYHNVLPVTRGKRMVLVAELWEGPERMCAHRCPCNVEMASTCDYTLGRSHVASVGQHVALLG